MINQTRLSKGGLFFCFMLWLLVWSLTGCADGQMINAVTPTVSPVSTKPPLPATATPTSLPQPTATPTATEPAIPATPTTIPTVEVAIEVQEFYYKGLTYVAAGLPEDALSSFNQAIALQPDYALAYLERGKLYMQQGQPALAKADYQYALEFSADPAIKAEVKNLLQQLTSIPAATATIPLAQATPTPQVTVSISTAPPLEAELGQPTTFPLGQIAHFKEANLTLTFESILEDSRCPSQVECFWSGQVRLVIRVQQGEIEATPFELITNPPSKQNIATYADYEIELLQIDPYPDAPDQPILPESYQATFVVKAK